MKVVSNTSPIINLAMIGHLHLLEQLYGHIIIPEGVFHEIVVRGKRRPGSQEVQEFNWIETRSVTNQIAAALQFQLGRGEAEAIALAIELNTDLLLLDEQNARMIALGIGIPITGILGVLLKSKQETLILSVKPLLDALKHDADFWIKDDLYAQILNMAGEA